MSNKAKNFWLAFLPPIVILLIQTLVQWIGAEFVYVGSVASFDGGTFQEFYSDFEQMLTGSTYTSLTLLIYSIIAIAVFTPWWSKNRCGFESRRMSFKGFSPVKLVAGVVLFVIGAQIVSNYLVSLLSAAFPKALARYSQIMKRAGLEAASITPVMLIYSAVLGPIAEEFAFRGLSLGYFKKSLPSFALANILQALLFGLIHMNFIQGAYAFLLGLLFGYVAHRTGSLMVTIVLHICFNSSSFVLQALSPKAINAGAFIAFATLVLSMMAVYIGLVLLISSQPLAKEK